MAHLARLWTNHVPFLFAILFSAGCESGVPAERDERPLVTSRSVSESPNVVPPSSELSIPVHKTAAEKPNPAKPKVARLQRRGRSQWLLVGEGTAVPKMCLVVLRKDWSGFDAKERAGLRPLIDGQIVDLKADPSKYAVCKVGAPAWDFVVQNIQHTVPAVMLSDGRTENGSFELGDTIEDFDSASSVMDEAAPSAPDRESKTDNDEPLDGVTPSYFVVLGSWPIGSVREPNRLQHVAEIHSVHAQIVDSDQYAKFRPGLTVVVSGPWTRDASKQELARVKRFVKDAYVKEGW